MLKRLNNAQKKYIYRNYDQFVKNNGVVIPGEADACVLAPIDGANNGVAITIDSNTYGTIDPYMFQGLMRLQKPFETLLQ